MTQNKEKTASNDESSQQEKFFVPDYSELWKEWYFRMEDIWSETFRQFITTKSFVNMMNSTLEQFLFNEKLSRQNMDRFLESSPFPTKTDIARVAELAVSLEEKIDNLEFNVLSSLESMADSLLKLVNYQANIKEELEALKKENQALTKKVASLNKELSATRTKASPKANQTTILKNSEGRRKT
jgi:polyhydroxyalkanoic acid synthase PhaR subunit